MPPTQDQIDAAVEQLAQVNKQVSDGLNAVNLIKLEGEGAQAMVDRLNTSIMIAQKQLDDVNASLDSATITRASILSDIEQANRDLSAAKSDLQSTLTANEQAKAVGIAATHDAFDTQAKIVADAQAEITDLKTQKDTLQKQIAPIAEQAGRLQQQILDMTVQITVLADQIAAGTKNLADMSAEVDAATQVVADKQATGDSLDTEITQKRDVSTQLDADVNDRTTSITDLDQQIKDLQAELVKNSTLNDDFLKARADLIAEKQLNDQRTQLLTTKYGKLGEPFN